MDILKIAVKLKKRVVIGTTGFTKKEENLIKKYSKKQIKRHANKNRLVWFEDRSNLELEYTRNKIRNYLYSGKIFKQIMIPLF